MGEKKRRENTRKMRIAEFETQDRYTSWMDVLDAWDLLASDPPISLLSLREWEKIGEAIQATYAVPDQPVLGSLTLGLNEAAGLSDGRHPLEKIVPYALTTERVWLPDPVYSALSPEITRISAQFGIPEPFTCSNGAHVRAMPSYCVWNAPITDRLDLLRQRMPSAFARVRQIRPLIACGAVRLSPWELSAGRFEEMILSAASAVQMSPETQRVTEQYPQEHYTLGVYFGGMGFTANDGSPLWINTKRPMVLYGAVNAVYAASLGASFLPQREGDREVFDYIMMQGRVPLAKRSMPCVVDIPDFSGALLPEIVAIRNDSESLSLLRDLMAKAAEMDDVQAIGAIERRLREIAERIREEASIWRAAKKQLTQMSVGILGGLGVGYATGGGPLQLLGSAGVGAFSALFQAVRDANRRARRGRAELLIRIAERMTR